MTSNIRKLLEQHNVTTLEQLSKEIGVSLNKVKNISSGRTSFTSLFQKKSQHRVSPKHSEELAELIGIVLGDGNIFQFDRCQRLTISCNSAYMEYVRHVKCLVSRILRKKASVIKRFQSNCYDVCLYMQGIDKALGLTAGSKKRTMPRIPSWIFKKKDYLIKCLKGLFETDGNYGCSKKHYVEFIQFCNKSETLKKSAYEALVSLGYSPQLGGEYVRLARKDQLHKFIKQVNFERPFPALVN